MKKEIVKKIQKNIKGQLKQRNKSIEDLTKAMKVNRNFISQLRSGTPIYKIVSIANAIGCSPAELLEGL